MMRLCGGYSTDMRNYRIKKWMCLLLLLLALPLLLSVSAPHASEPRVRMTARITALGERIAVEVIESPYTFGPHLVHTPPETLYRSSDGEAIDRTALAVGDVVEISYSGQVMLSYPPQIVAVEIKRLG